MPNREFLENYPLYRKFEIDIPNYMSQLEMPAIHMKCFTCDSGQTFNLENEILDLVTLSIRQNDGQVVCAVYKCSSCQEFKRYFLLKFDPEGKYMLKVGQWPSWDITPDRVLDEAVGVNSHFYKRGLICESQGYGIGAFSYYRRIVEEIIDKLLEDVAGLLSGDELNRYQDALGLVKKTSVTKEKIAIVKDILPPILRPDEMNPLSTLHSILSEGLHNKTDEECIEAAATVREVLVFLVNQVETTQTSSARFTESMRRLLDSKNTGLES